MAGRPPVYPLRAMRVGEIVFIPARGTPLRKLQQTLGSAIGSLRRRLGCPDRIYKTHQIQEPGFQAVAVKRLS